jgi:hypothetical protein
MTARPLAARTRRLIAVAALAACSTTLLASAGAPAANAAKILAKAPSGASAPADVEAKRALRCRSTLYWSATCRPRLINWAIRFARAYAAGHPRQIGGFHFDPVGHIRNCGYIAPNEARCTLTLPGYRLVPGGGEWGLDYTQVRFRKIVTVFAHVDQFNRVGRTVRDNQSGLF